VTEVRCEHNAFSQVPSLARCEHTVLKTFGVFKNKNSRTLDKGRVRTAQKSSQSTVEQGENISKKLAGYSGAGCEPLRKVSRLQWSRVRTSQDSLQATHRQGANSLQAALRRGVNLPGQGESEGVEFFGWITFKFARFSWCDT
jgi:hypothetical protein